MNSAKKTLLLRILAAAYCLLMLWLLFGQRFHGWDGEPIRRMNLVPFKTISPYLRSLGPGNAHAFINLAGNVVMFVPLGFFLPCIFHRLRSFWKTVASAFIIIAAIELIQYFSGLGSLDIDDLILNLPGALIGYLIYRLIQKYKII